MYIHEYIRIKHEYIRAAINLRFVQTGIWYSDSKINICLCAMKRTVGNTYVALFT